MLMLVKAFIMVMTVAVFGTPLSFASTPLSKDNHAKNSGSVAQSVQVEKPQVHYSRRNAKVAVKAIAPSKARAVATKIKLSKLHPKVFKFTLSSNKASKPKVSLISAPEFTVAKNATIIAPISNVETNRISLVDDRISNVIRNDTKYYRITGNPNTGDIFLFPNPKAKTSQKALNLFITSEKGRTYQLILKPNSLTGQQIILRDRQLQESTGEAAKLGSFYYSAIAQKIKDMALRPLPLDRKPFINKKTAKFTVSFLKKSTVKNLVFLQGFVVNTTDSDVTLHKNSILFEGQRALWLEKSILKPSERTRLIVVISIEQQGSQ